MSVRLPVVIVSIQHRFEPLDACLAALENSLPGRTRVWILDDVSSDPRIESLVRAWCESSSLDATYRRRQQILDPAESCNAAFEETGPDDVVLVDVTARPTSGWLAQLAGALRDDANIATATPWSNLGELCAFPNFGEDNALPEFPELTAEAAAGGNAALPELPAASPQCVLISRAALARIGALDATSHPQIADALVDFSLRAASMGWRNVLRDTAYVAHDSAAAAAPGGGNFPRLLARWPDYHERVARFILTDPLRPLRARLAERIAMLQRSGPQRDLFATP